MPPPPTDDLRPPPGYAGYEPGMAAGAARLESVSGPAKGSIIAVGITAALGLVTSLVQLGALGKAEDFLDGTISEDEFEDSFAAASALSLLVTPAQIVAIIFTCIWLSRILGNHRKVLRQTTWSSGWGAGGWFLPPFLFVIPLLAIREAWQAVVARRSARRSDDGSSQVPIRSSGSGGCCSASSRWRSSRSRSRDSAASATRRKIWPRWSRTPPSSASSTAASDADRRDRLDRAGAQAHRSPPAAHRHHTQMSLYVVRHAKAGSRSTWDGDDDVLRPLSKAGEKQADGIADRLHSEIDAGQDERPRLVSSPYVRCMETLVPLGARLGLAVEPDDRLAEGWTFEPALELLDEVPDGSVLCTHGDVLPDLIAALERRGLHIDGEPDWRKGATWRLERNGDGAYVSATPIPPPTAS